MFVAAFIMLSFTLLSAPNIAHAAGNPIQVNQCNGTDNVGGQQVECDITIVNNLNTSTGATSSTLTVNDCHGAANAVPTCVLTTTTSTELINSATQCNGSGNGGGGIVTCNVNIINNITGTTTPTPVTVNQCNTAGTGGGTEPTILCNPFPANTTNATVTQCNEAGTDGGGTERVKCNVATASAESNLTPVTVNQCIGSGNGGGAYVTCATSLITNVLPPTDGGTTPPTDGGTTPPTDGGTTPPVVVPPTETTPPTGSTPPTDNTPPKGSTPPNGTDTPELAETGAEATPALLIGVLALIIGGSFVLFNSLRTKQG